MQLTRLRLAGFKTFVEPTEVPIEPGLTGIVGPNGCGKSNLVEALRWAMGESSHRALRASEMDDVIFAGNTKRPGRNFAEVALRIDNNARRAPNEFNDHDEIEIVRAITRGLGSSYRVNGREARARDVQTLFADVSSGARSPALIGQGRVSEIINARPEQRRRILEDAAGIAGLAARRHEAELRLKGAEQNLERAEDVLSQLDARIGTLRRQVQVATRYRNLSTELRRVEAVRLLLGWQEAKASVLEGERNTALATAALANAIRAQGEAARIEAVSEHELTARRSAASEAVSLAQQVKAELERVQTAEREARLRLSELTGRIAATETDLSRERQLQADAEDMLRQLAEHETTIEADGAAGNADLDQLASILGEAEAALAGAELALNEALREAAERKARRAAAVRSHAEAAARLARIMAEANRHAASAPVVTEDPALSAAQLGAALEHCRQVLAAAEMESGKAEQLVAAARTAERHAQVELGTAEKSAATRAAEVATLRRFVEAHKGKADRPVIDDIEVEPGYERALAAALGEELDVSEDTRQPRHWANVADAEYPGWPDGVEPLSRHVRTPAALNRRMVRIGLVDAADGPAARNRLAPGQRLVSREGHLWRWDGLTQSPDAESAAARRLTERNRLEELAQEAAKAEAGAQARRHSLHAAQAAAREAAEAQQRAQDRLGTARSDAASARESLAAAERRRAEAEIRRAAREEAGARIEAMRLEAEHAFHLAERDLADLGGDSDESAADTRTDPARSAVQHARAQRDAAAAADAGERRALAERTRRLEALVRERQAWTDRQERAATRITDLSARLTELTAAKTELAELPESASLQSRRLTLDLAVAEETTRRAATALSGAEAERAEHGRQARTALEVLQQAREEVVRTEERLATARDRLLESAEAIEEATGMAAAVLATRTQIGNLDRPAADAEIARLARDRDRLGPVNLAAEGELTEVERGRDALIAERDDIVSAVRQLRRAIQTLNEEGRTRLHAAFEQVNANFLTLFSTLFGGGEAHLELIETDDPLGAGLEVHAKLPGKREHTLSLLSGGEQALTALALVFAVFLTCPSPICVLDEVDAPLDDANVERFCALLEAMTTETRTRFLVVTHNPITMSRMHRLLGVTMAERGVSQLVTVALAEAERFLEAV